MKKIQNFVLGLVIVALIAGAGAIALNEFRNETRDTSSTTILNESQTVTIGTPVTLSSYELQSISAVRNASGVTLNSGEYQTLKSVNQFNITNASKASGTVFYIDYSIKPYSYTYNITTSGLEGIDNTMDFADTWGVIVGVVALITIVVGGFYMFRRT